MRTGTIFPKLPTVKGMNLRHESPGGLPGRRKVGWKSVSQESANLLAVDEKAESGSIQISELKSRLITKAANLISHIFGLSDEEVRLDLNSALDKQDRFRPVFFTAVIGEELIGLVECHKGPEYERVNMYAISKLLVDPAYRRRGIARMLLDSAEAFIAKEWMKGKPGVVTIMDTSAKDGLNANFYERRGYVAGTPPKTMEGWPIVKKKLNV